jgi:tripartite-type tricarboxylate transporter receptor subunit TctC
VKLIARFVVYAGVAFFAQVAPSAFAQNFPVKPIRLVVGPGSDLLPRLLGQKLAGMWGQQIVVDQRTGAGGVLALETAAKSPADGYTWILSTATYSINAGMYPHATFSIGRDFDPVVLAATATFYLLVHPSVPVKSVMELIQLARARPGQLNYSSAGVATPPHLAGEMFKSMATVNIIHVPYKSAAAATTDLVGGQVQVSIQYVPIAHPYVQSGKLRALAVTSLKRSLIAPDLPTVAESGVPGYEVIGWNGLHMPAGAPKQIIARVNADVLQILKLEDVKERMVIAGLEPAGMATEEFAAFVKRDLAHWAKAIAQAGVHGE